MAEFQMVVSEYKRMCESYKKNCDYCPMPIFGCDKDACRRYVFKCPEESENTIMTWAAEHPEPFYPTWGEYLASIGVMKPAQPDKAYEVWFSQLYSTNIAADIAQKLGIEPKKG